MDEQEFKIKVVKDLGEIKVLIAEKPCSVHSGEIKLLNKAVFGLIALIVVGFLTTQFFPQKTTAETQKHQIIRSKK